MFSKAPIHNFMDDIIYFLLLIGWLGYSIYKQSEKKKKMLAQKKALEPEPYQQGTPAAGPFSEERERPVIDEPDFAKTLEEILLGKNEIESLEEIPETEVQSLESIPEPVNQYAEYNKKDFSNQSFWYKEEPEVVRSTIEVPVEEPEPVAVEEDSGLLREELHHFKLRTAVVYSEILNRKYA